ncbi:DUF2184 domain-containing protein [Paenibacillus glucanolyticus]|uniref:DUF2184 domain-containing protein n=1 Tax=Paenibacillus glucanolyticus TaxID=59843 RepID=UPI0035E037CA
MRNDAAINVQFRPLDLEAVDRTVYEPKTAELTARRVLNVKTDVPAGAETYAYDVMTRSGVAKILANNADDVPLVDIDMRREFVRIYSIVTGFRYSVQDLRAAQMTGKPVDTAKAGVARRAISEKENRLAWIGDPDYNIQGLINATGIQTANVPVNPASKLKWADKTGEEILEDIRIIRALVTVLPGHDISSNLTLVVPPAQYEVLNRRFNTTDARTILEVIQSRDWFGDIVKAAELKGAGTGGTDSFLVLDSSREVVELLVPMDIYRHDPEWKFPAYKIALEERCGGAVIRYPMAIARGDGI